MASMLTESLINDHFAPFFPGVASTTAGPESQPHAITQIPPAPTPPAPPTNLHPVAPSESVNQPPGASFPSPDANANYKRVDFAPPLSTTTTNPSSKSYPYLQRPMAHSSTRSTSPDGSTSNGSGNQPHNTKTGRKGEYVVSKLAQQ